MTQVADGQLARYVQPAAGGDEAAFERIVSECHDDMCRVCTFITGDQALAEDAVQAAWSIAWRQLDKLRDPERVRAWLIRISINEAKKLLQSRGRRWQSEVQLDPSRIPGGADPVTGIDSLDMLAAVGRLDPDERSLLALRYGLGYDSTELAAAMDISAAGVRQRLKRLLDQLRRELA